MSCVQSIFACEIVTKIQTLPFVLYSPVQISTKACVKSATVLQLRIQAPNWTYMNVIL